MISTFKKILTFSFIIIALLSVNVFAAENVNNIRKEVEGSVSKYEGPLQAARAQLNLSPDDIIQGNVYLGDIYQNHFIDVTKLSKNNKKVSDIVKPVYYMAPLKLKSSNKTIGFVQIENINSTWMLTTFIANDKLGTDISDFKLKNKVDPILIYDPKLMVYGLGLDSGNEGAITFVIDNKAYSIESKKTKNVKDLSSTILRENSQNNESNNAVTIGGGSNIYTTFNNSNRYTFMVISLITAFAIIGVYVNRRYRSIKPTK